MTIEKGVSVKVKYDPETGYHTEYLKTPRGFKEVYSSLNQEEAVEKGYYCAMILEPGEWKTW